MNAIYSFLPLAFDPPRFDEVLYLKANPDIAEAIAGGVFKSGFEHWLRHGQQEGRPRFPQSTKIDLINHLAHVRGYRSYLEICTPTSGLHYAEVDRSKFKICHRLMYRCPKYFDDGMTVDFRSSDLEIGDCVKIIGQQRYDVILVDGFHTYETTLRDLKLALDLLAEEGTIVVHDCDPPNEQVASTQFNPTGWCGVTYKAYLDFVLGRDDLAYCTVDTDAGCGIIRKKKPGVSCAGSSDGNSVTDEWRRLGQDFHAAFHYLQVNKVSLLNLTTTQDFGYTEGVAGLTRLIDARDEELRQKDEEIAELNSVLTAMLGSKSWKITGPLRALWRLFHAGGNGEDVKPLAEQERILERIESGVDFRQGELLDVLQSVVAGRFLTVVSPPTVQRSRRYKGLERRFPPDALQRIEKRIRFGMEQQDMPLEWDGLEKNEHGTFRWTGVSREATIDLPILFDRDLLIRINILAMLRPALADGLKLSVHGHPLDVRIDRRGSIVLEAEVRHAHVNEGRDFGVTIDTGGATRPCDVGVGTDPRWLGVAVNWIEVEPLG